MNRVKDLFAITRLKTTPPSSIAKVTRGPLTGLANAKIYPLFFLIQILHKLFFNILPINTL